MDAKKLEILMTAVDLGSFPGHRRWSDTPSLGLPIW